MDELISNIVKLENSLLQKGVGGNFGSEDLKVSIVLNVIKGELFTGREISDLTFGAFNALAGCSYQNYKGFHDDIHDFISNIDELLYEFNNNPYKADINSPDCHNKGKWLVYFEKSIEKLL